MAIACNHAEPQHPVRAGDAGKQPDATNQTPAHLAHCESGLSVRGAFYGGSTLMYAADPRVDAYIEALPDWQQAICRGVRDLVHAADPEVTETIKYTDRPYFVLEGNLSALLAAKDHVNVFLYDGAIVPDPEGIITGGHANETARTVAVCERGDQRTRPDRDVQADHRQQPRRWLAQAEARSLIRSPSPALRSAA